MNPLHSLLLLLVVAVWGVNFVFVRIGLNELTPMFLVFTRFFIVSIPAVFFFKRPPIPFRQIFLYAAVMFILHFTLIFSGIRAGISPGLASLLLQTQVFFSMFFATLFLKERMDPWQIGGSLVAFLGIGVIFLNLQGSATLNGFFLVLASALGWGLGSILVKKMGKIHSGSLLVWSGLAAWPPLLILSLIFEESAPLLLRFHALSSDSYGAILFIALFSTAFGFGVWNWLIQIYPISTVAPFTLLVPIFAMIGSVLILDEPIEPWKLFAASLVILGLCLNLLGSRRLSRVKF
jgi:O-acetylserine/cysteine efflux transporter